MRSCFLVLPTLERSDTSEECQPTLPGYSFQGANSVAKAGRPEPGSERSPFSSETPADSVNPPLVAKLGPESFQTKRGGECKHA